MRDRQTETEIEIDRDRQTDSRTERERERNKTSAGLPLVSLRESCNNSRLKFWWPAVAGFSEPNTEKES